MKPARLQKLNELCDVVAEQLSYDRGGDEDLQFVYELAIADYMSDDSLKAHQQTSRLCATFEINDSAIEMLISWYLKDKLPKVDNVPF